MCHLCLSTCLWRGFVQAMPRCHNNTPPPPWGKPSGPRIVQTIRVLAY